MFFIGWGLPTLDPELGVGIFRKEAWAPGLNTMFYSNPAVEALIPAQRAATDPKERCEIVKWIQKIIMEDAPMIALYYEPQIHAKRKGVHDFVISVTERIDEVLIRNTWLEE